MGGRGAVVLALALVVGTLPVVAGSADATYHGEAVQSETAIESNGFQSADDPAGVNNSTIFRRVETEQSTFVVDMNMSMLTSMFAKGSTFRLVTGGTVEGDRVVWFDIGIGYSGGSVLDNPLDEFVVRSEMWMDFPGF